MVSLEDAVIARLESGGHRFEILIDPNEAQSYKEGDEIDWEDSIAVDGVWADTAKGERSPENILDEFFGSSDLIEIYKKILTEGTIQLTSEQKKEMIDNKKKQILSHIVANAMNPQTGGAHPPQRIENAIVEAKYGNLFQMYEKIVDDNPYKTPMMIYPATHYTMGGIWVDYNLMTTIPGCYAIGEANFSDHGANRLGASALMQGLADGYFVLPYTIGDYLADDIRTGKISTDTKEFDEAEKSKKDERRY